MIITKLQGGLGNQMFQYAVAFGYGRKIHLDFSFLEKHNTSNAQFTKRDFELSLFPKLKYRLFTPQLRQVLFSSQKRYRIIRKVMGIKLNIVKQKENEFLKIDKNKHMYFDGFFQSEKYFIQKRKDLLEAYTFPDLDQKNNRTKEEILKTPNAVSIHIRRGDYLKEEVKKYHGVLDQKYYDDAIELIKKKYANTHFYVFSDDEEYAESLYGHLDNFSIIKENSKEAWKDMALMTYCKHHIIANSSFSWWGAWLSTRDGLKIAPKNWFNPEVVNFEIDIIIPSNWIKI